MKTKLLIGTTCPFGIALSTVYLTSSLLCPLVLQVTLHLMSSTLDTDPCLKVVSWLVSKVDKRSERDSSRKELLCNSGNDIDSCNLFPLWHWPIQVCCLIYGSYSIMFYLDTLIISSILCKRIKHPFDKYYKEVENATAGNVMWQIRESCDMMMWHCQSNKVYHMIQILHCYASLHRLVDQAYDASRSLFWCLFAYHIFHSHRFFLFPSSIINRAGATEISWWGEIQSPSWNVV